MNENENELVDQLRLSMSILSGRRPANSVEPNTPDAALLRLTAPIAQGDVLRAAEEITCEIVLAALGKAQTPSLPPDPKMLAVALIHEIQDNGGWIDKARIHLPPDFLMALLRDGVIREGLTTVTLGRNAERALRDMESD